MILNLLARALASSPRAVDWLIQRAHRTPYYPITSMDGTEIYMWRGWLFNPYGKDGDGDVTPPRWAWLPSIRVHHIRRADQDRHEHDHPWNARTFILRGWYIEQRGGAEHMRAAGYTGRLMFGEYHRIAEVCPAGVWTLFVTGRKRGGWGFWVDGRKVGWREYLTNTKEPTNG